MDFPRRSHDEHILQHTADSSSRYNRKGNTSQQTERETNHCDNLTNRAITEVVRRTKDNLRGSEGARIDGREHFGPNRSARRIPIWLRP